MHKCHERLKFWIREVTEVGPQLVGGQLALVDDGGGGERANVEPAARPRNPVGGLLPRDPDFPGEELVVHVLASSHEDLAHEGLGSPGHLADGRAIRRDRPPTQHLEAMRRGQVGEELLALLVVGLVHEEDPGGVASGLGQFHVVLALQDALVEGVRDRGQETRPVAGVVVAGAGAAMLHARCQLLGIADDLGRRDALDVDDEPHAAGSRLVAGVVQPLGLGVLPRLHHPRRFNLLTSSSFLEFV